MNQEQKHNDAKQDNVQPDDICRSFTELGQYILNHHGGDETAAKETLLMLFGLLESEGSLR